MEEDITKAQHYRDQAIHLRALAAKDDNRQTRESLTAVAEEYDRLFLKFLGLAEDRADNTVVKFKR